MNYIKDKLLAQMSKEYQQYTSKIKTAQEAFDQAYDIYVWKNVIHNVECDMLDDFTMKKLLHTKKPLKNVSQYIIGKGYIFDMGNDIKHAADALTYSKGLER